MPARTTFTMTSIGGISFGVSRYMTEVPKEEKLWSRNQNNEEDGRKPFGR